MTDSTNRISLNDVPAGVAESEVRECDVWKFDADHFVVVLTTTERSIRGLFQHTAGNSHATYVRALREDENF